MLKRCNPHLHNGGALVNMDGLGRLMSLLDKDQNMFLMSFFFFIKMQTTQTQMFVTHHPS